MTRDASQLFLIGQRVRISATARGDWPDAGHWIALAEYAPREGEILYGVTENWPPTEAEDVHEGFRGPDLSLWPD